MRDHKKLVFILVGLVFGMFGFGFALVPIYKTLCRELGINGKTNTTAFVYDSTKGGMIDLSRSIVVQFVTTKNGQLPWQFYPEIKRVIVHPGEMKRVAFYGRNDTGHYMVVQAIPSITPGLAAKYFKKTECFCFTQQPLQAHEARDFPLLFHLDPELPEEIHTITLSYTLFDITKRVSKT